MTNTEAVSNDINQSLEDQWGDAFNEAAAAPAAPSASAAPAAAQAKPAAEQVRPASFGTLKQDSSAPVGNLDMILDIPITMSVELGRMKMLVKDLLQLGQGTVVELDKLAGEPMEILVNGKLIARGEAVVVNEKFGVKLTDIVSPTERISKLG